MRKWTGLGRWMALGLLTSLVLAGCNSATNALRKIDPTRAYVDTFEGRYIDQVGEATAGEAPSGGGDGSKIYLPDGFTLARVDSQGVVAQPLVEAYLNGILKRLAAQAPGEAVSARVVVVAESSVLQAKSTPDGVIMVPLGAMAVAESEDELAWLLAHEFSHILLHHHDSDWLERFQNKSVAMAQSGLTMLDTLQKMAEKMPQGAIDPTLRDRLVKAYLVAKNLYEVSNLVLLPGWQRKQEDEADLLGTDLMVKAGYNPVGGSDLLERMKREAREEERLQEEALQRRETERKMAEQLKQANAEEMKAVFSKVLNDAFVGLKKRLSRKHRFTEERLNNLAAYVEREYESETDREPRSADLDKLRKRPTVARLLSNYRQVWRAERLLAEQRLDEAEKAIRRGASVPTKYDSKVRLIFFRIRSAQGKQGLAQKNLELALGQDPRAALQVYTTYVKEMISIGEESRALSTLNKAFQDFGEAPFLYPSRIRLAMRLGRKADAAAYLMECRVLDHTYTEECEKAVTN